MAKFRNFGLNPSFLGASIIMNLKEPFVITVSREIGSGGRTIGRILAGKLNVPCCDRYLVEALEKELETLRGELSALRETVENLENREEEE